MVPINDRSLVFIMGGMILGGLAYGLNGAVIGGIIGFILTRVIR